MRTDENRDRPGDGTESGVAALGVEERSDETPTGTAGLLLMAGRPYLAWLYRSLSSNACPGSFCGLSRLRSADTGTAQASSPGAPSRSCRRFGASRPYCAPPRSIQASDSTPDPIRVSRALQQRNRPACRGAHRRAFEALTSGDYQNLRHTSATRNCPSGRACR